MHPVLRSILGDRVLLALLVALAIQGWRVADSFELLPLGSGSPSEVPKFKDIIDRLAQGESIEIPSADGITSSFSLPPGLDGKPIDIRQLFNEGGEKIENAYERAERDYGPADSRTLTARSALASIMLYRGENQRANELLNLNFEIVVSPSTMPAELRLQQLLNSVVLLEAIGGPENSDRLARTLRIVRLYGYQAPEPAAKILNRIAIRNLESRDFAVAADYFREAQRMPLDHSKHGATMIEAGMGLTGALFRNGAIDDARKEARKTLMLLGEADTESVPARAAQLMLLEKMFEKLDDPAYASMAKEMQAKAK